jgi:hypothetical protein
VIVRGAMDEQQRRLRGDQRTRTRVRVYLGAVDNQLHFRLSCEFHDRASARRDIEQG